MNSTVAYWVEIFLFIVATIFFILIYMGVFYEK